MKFSKVLWSLGVLALGNHVVLAKEDEMDEDDAAHHKSKNDYKDDYKDYRDPDFDDNTNGYCTLEKGTILAIDDLMETPLSALGIWFDYYYRYGSRYEVIKPEIQGFADLARDFIEDDSINKLVSDRDILAVMTQNVPSPVTNTLTSECEIAITNVLREINSDFFALMGVGTDPVISRRRLMEDITEEEQARQLEMFSRDLQTTSFLPLFLAIFKDTSATTNDAYVRFIDAVRLRTRVITPKALLDGAFTAQVGSWFEAAATAKSFASKYAAFEVIDDNNGLPLLVDWIASMSLEAKYDALFAATVATCDATPKPTVPPGTPTAAPSSMPTQDNLAFLDEFTPMVAVVDGDTAASQATLETSFTAFRARFPSRPFCVLNVDGSTNPLQLPVNMLTDGNVILRRVNRDFGSTFMQEDWFDLCNLSTQLAPAARRRLQDGPVPGVTTIGFTITVPVTVVQASYNFFFAKMGSLGFSIVIVATPTGGNFILALTIPIVNPTDAPTASPSSTPSKTPSGSPSANPSTTPSKAPSLAPSTSKAPSSTPSRSPSSTPSAMPSLAPSTSKAPSTTPSSSPSLAPSTSKAPSTTPSTSPSLAPSVSKAPSTTPSTSPSLAPSTSKEPSSTPSVTPSRSPSTTPSSSPSLAPSVSIAPSVSKAPSLAPSASKAPSTSPSSSPSLAPSVSFAPSVSKAPSLAPSASKAPSSSPTT